MLDNKSRSEYIHKGPIQGIEGVGYIRSNSVQAIQQYIEDQVSSRVAVIQENYEEKLEEIQDDYDEKLEKIYDECNNLYQSYHLSGGW